MRYFTNNRPSAAVIVLSLLGFVIAIGLTKVVDFDIWWHLKTGEVIWKWRTIPKFDLFSYTASGAPWVNHEWLYQVVMWLAVSKLGFWTATLVKLICTAAITFFSYKTLRLFVDSTGAALWGTFIILFGIADRVIDRPHIFSLVFLLYYCYALHSFSAGRKKNLYVLPFLQILWINLHGAGLFGAEVVIAFALGESLQAFFNGPPAIEKRRRRHLWFVGLGCLAASAINPHGVDAIIFPFLHFKMETIMAFTQEWMPAFDPRLDGIVSQIIFKLILVATLVSYLVNRKNARMSHLMLTILASLIVLRAKRFTPDFIIINVPIIFLNLKSSFAKVKLSPNSGHLHTWGHVLLMIMLSMLAVRDGIPATVHGGRTADVGLGTTEEFAPYKMVNFLEENNVHGRVFNEMGLGGYLIYKRWPGELVFIDGRTPVYGDDFYREFVNVFQNSKNFDELDALYKFDYMVFKSDQVWQVRFFHKYLSENANWKLIYSDPNEGLVYVKNIPKFKGVISKFAYKKHPLVEQMKQGGE